MNNLSERVDIGLMKDVIEELQKQRWIPCSERLPSEEGCYLASGSGGCVYVAKFMVVFGKRGSSVMWWKQHTQCRVRPLAWQPLPKPYRP